MNLGILSDSHDHLDNIRKAAGIFLEAKVEAVIHAGDLCSPFFFTAVGDLKRSGVKMYAVFGNNDGDRVLLSQRGVGFCEFKDFAHKLEFAGKRVAVMHYPDLAESIYKSGDFDLVIFGHSHRRVFEQQEECILLNPGTCAGYLADQATVALFNTEERRVKIIPLS